MKRISALAYVLTFTSLAACASVPPPRELQSARSAYDRASHDDTARQNPAGLHDAKLSLDSAERSFAEEGDSPATRDAAYVAERQVLLAEARARTARTMKQRSEVVKESSANQALVARTATRALSQANQQLANQSEQLNTERERRQQAEKQAAQATADLARVATVTQDTRGMVITLSGSVLFASGKSELLPAAQARLSSVATALAAQDPDSKLVVEGHTDSQGSADANQALSQRRAESVRSYLVGHGIAADRVVAQGFGLSRPVSENSSPEGRANNRRVEIIVAPAKG